MRENEVTVLRSTEERVARTSCLSVKRDAPPGFPPTECPLIDHIFENMGHTSVKLAIL